MRRGIGFFLCLFLLSNTAYARWETIATGWLYKKILYNSPNKPSSAIYLFKVDPKKVRIDVVTAEQFGMKSASAQTLAVKSGAALVINGGFFDENFNSLGLLIQDGRRINPIRPISWWGIFWIDDTGGHISHHADFVAKPDIKTAIQSGPRTVINGKVPKLKEKPPSRCSAICISKDDRVLIIETGQTLLTPHELADLMLKDELGCVNGLALDGGSSSQLYAKHKDFVLLLEGESTVTNGLALFPSPSLSPPLTDSSTPKILY